MSTSPRRKRAVHITLYLVFLAALGWVGVRLALKVRYGTPVMGRQGVEAVWLEYYPELKVSGVVTADVARADEAFDVVLLGASTMGQLSMPLAAALTRRSRRPVRVFSLCANGHTSRDTYLKWMAIRDRPFDLVVMCQAINDARMNCVPADRFRDDYTHCVWYHRIAKRTAAGGFKAADIIEDLIPVENPSPLLWEEGADIKTAAPFRRNLEQLVTDMAGHGGTVLLATLSVYVPDDYSHEKLLNDQLDYGPRRFPGIVPLETWGKKEHVLAAVDRHNAVIRAIAAEHDNVVLVDLAAQLPKEGKYFSDPCHLTVDGMRFALERMLKAMEI